MTLPSVSDKRTSVSRLWSAYLLLAAAPLLWAGNIVLARGVVDIIPPVSLAFWRWAMASAILLPFAWKKARQDWLLVLQNWKIMLLLSLSGITCFNTLLYIAVHTTTSINAALIQTAMPAVIMMICLLLYGEKVSRFQIIGAVVCMAGASMVVLRGDLGTLLKMSLAKGDALMMLAVVLYAFYSALLKKSPPIHPLSLLIYTFCMGTLGLMPFYILEIIFRGTVEATTPVILSIFYVAAFPSIVAYFCWNRGIALLGANRAGLFINLIPVFASLMAIVLLGEALHLFHVAAMAMLASGIAIFNYTAKA